MKKVIVGIIAVIGMMFLCDNVQANSTSCSITINSDLSFKLENVTYSTLLGNMDLWASFKFFGEQNGKMLWKLEDAGSSQSSSCSTSIKADLSFDISKATYSSLIGDTDLWTNFKFFGDQNGTLLWYLDNYGVIGPNTAPDPTVSTDPNSNQNASYFEFHVGDSFKFREDPVSGSGYAPRYKYININTDIVIGSKKYYIHDFKEVNDNGNSNSWTLMMRTDFDGNLWVKPSSTIDEILYISKDASSVGYNWTISDSEGTHYYKVESTSDTVTVPAGTFNNCLKLYNEKISTKNPQDNFTGYEWIAPGIGTIKEENTKRISELVEATVNGVSYP